MSASTHHSISRSGSRASPASRPGTVPGDLAGRAGTSNAPPWEARRRRELLEIQPPTKLSHLLRILGAQLDKNAARAFSIFWTPNSVVVDYKRAGGFTDRLRLSPATIGETISGGFHRGIVALPRRYV